MNNMYDDKLDVRMTVVMMMTMTMTMMMMMTMIIVAENEKRGLESQV